MVQCVLDLGDPVCFLDLGEPVCFWTSVVQCVFWTSVIQCVSDLSSLVCFRTSVVYCILDLGGQLRFCSTRPESVVGSFVSLGLWWLSVILIVLDLRGHLMLDFDAKCNSVAATIARAQ